MRNTHPRLPVLLPALFLAGLAAVPAAQLVGPSPARPTPLPTFGSGYGRRVADVGDVDADGRRDLGVACPLEGTVRIHSGFDLRPLAVIQIPVAGQNLELAGAGDVDGDGRADVIVGAPDDGGGNGRVMVFSGRTGALLHQVLGSGAAGYGASVAGAGDADGDGLDDWAFGAPDALIVGEDRGAVYVYSGASGASLYFRFGTKNAARLGTSLANVGDVDGDGFDDLLAGGPGVYLNVPGEALVLSPRKKTTLRTHTTTNAGLSLGLAVSALGDANGDGRADYAVSSPGAVQSEGNVEVFSGANGALLFQKPLYGTPLSAWGLQLAPAGDLNGDGKPDLLVVGLGAAAVMSGANGQFLGAQASGIDSVCAMVDLDGDGLPEYAGGDVASETVSVLSLGTFGALLTRASDERFGGAVAIVPDVDADGLPDLLVSAPYRTAAGPSAGVVRLHSSENGSLLRELSGSQGDAFGTSLAALGDIDGNGAGELLVGSPSDLTIALAGAVHIYSATSGALLRTHIGSAPGDRFGEAVANLGDVNGDGVDDYAVGSPGATSSFGVRDVGKVQAYSGLSGAFLWSRLPTSLTRSVRYGAALARVGDVDGDGRSELLVGAPDPLGGIDLLSGATGARLLHVAPPGGTVGLGARYGAAVAGPGDLSGDGVPDLLVGAPGYDAGRGRAWLLSGVDGTTLRTYSSLLTEALGAAVAGPGDVDNDGVLDVAIGAPLASGILGLTPGRVRVYSGATGAVIRQWIGTQSGERFGATLGVGGDVDGDGLPDLVTGATNYAGDPTHQRTGRVAVLSPRAQGSEHYGDDTPGCAGGHLLSLGQPASPGGVFDVRASGLTPQATPVLLVTLGRLEPPVPILGNVLLHVNLALLAEGVQLPNANGHLVAPLLIPNGPSWTGLEVDAQIVFLWPGGCPALTRPFSASNAIEVTIQ